MTTNNTNPPSYAPVSREDSGNPFNSPPAPSRSGSTNSIPQSYRPFGHSGPTSSSASSTMSKQSGAPMVLYRLAPHSGEPGSNRSSTVSQTPSLINEDNKYPSFRGLSEPSSPSSSRHRLPHAALFSSTPSSTHAPLSQNPPRGLVPYEYDPVTDSMMHEEDDVLHDPKSTKEQFRKAAGPQSGGLSWRGFKNMGMLVVLVAGMLGIFLVYPVVRHYQDEAFVKTVSENIHINGTGQLPDLALSRDLVDKDSPQNVRTRTGFDGQKYTLVYSDEFEQPGRTFYPGDDPYLEAMDFWYGVTGDMEWYDPRQIITRDGALVITMDADMNRTTQAGLTPGSTAPFSAKDNHGLSFRSGMIQSWNKLCFTSGYVEVAVTLPGPNSEQNGYWPGAWTMGNLGRPGYRATTDAMWPYSYDECDVGTFINQTNKGNTGPAVAVNTGKGWEQYDGRLSVLNGQRLSACTCPNSDHPGPWSKIDGVDRYRGRGAPEIDIIEIQHNDIGPGNVASQSAQFAPFTAGWEFDKTGYTIYDSARTHLNGYQGSPLQQAVSGLTRVPDDGFQGAPNKRFVTYGFEWWADPNDRDNSFITWQVDGKPSVKLTPKAVGPDKGPEGSQVGQRIIPEEPMAMILNMGISKNWGAIDFDTLIFPAEMQFDYIRIYQREGHTNIGCNPKDYPTMDYIQRHLEAYSNWEQVDWKDGTPKNRLYDGC
ncbi:hypothetical protein AAF712_013522 [Marasmius tenuissimus]|uniref:GH16 domain-containing protein n=1 Tax=Marasmius tenuissimus TaxID=585030 RepID=A0ABR2ZDQ8_9AGAR